MPDATFITVPIQRNNKEDIATIKSGEIPAHWPAKKEAHKETDARWTKKGNESHYGYKDHINVDKKSKLITEWTSTAANVNDGEVFESVLRDKDEGGAEVSADSAYRSEATENMLAKNGYKSRIHERAYRNKPLTSEQREIKHQSQS